MSFARLNFFFSDPEIGFRLGGDLGLGLELAADLGAGQDVLAVLIKLELGDDDVGRVQAQGHGLAGDLVAGDALDVDDVFHAVDGGDLALTALVGAAGDKDLVVLADGDAADLLYASVLGGLGREEFLRVGERDTNVVLFA